MKTVGRKKRKPLALALGNFDGVHRGHRVILEKLVRAANRNGWQPAVYIFNPHPARIFAPESAPPLIQTLEQRLAAFAACGIQTVIIEKFDERFSKRSPESFFSEILLKRLGAAALFIGYDFTFGHRRAGTAPTLKTLCAKKGIPLTVIAPQFEGRAIVSSTRIRQFVRHGRMEEAARLLGRPFALAGKVVRGKGIGGRRLGLHTANMAVENELLPKTGIYITRTRLLGRPGKKKEWASATSCGFNPTFPEKDFSVETHLIGFEGNLRGKKIEVEFLKYLRDEFCFPTPESLADQIWKDIEAAKRYYETLRHHR